MAKLKYEVTNAKELGIKPKLPKQTGLAHVNNQLRAELALAKADVASYAERERSAGKALLACEMVGNELREENNQLRDRLFKALTEAAEHRGYLDGLEDAKPPRMVPEERESRRARIPDGSQAYALGSGGRAFGSNERPKVWYHK